MASEDPVIEADADGDDRVPPHDRPGSNESSVHVGVDAGANDEDDGDEDGVDGTDESDAGSGSEDAGDDEGSVSDEAADDASDKAAATRARVRETLAQAREQIDRLEEKVLFEAKIAAREADRFVRERPWQAVGIAAAVGLVIGVLVSRK